MNILITICARGGSKRVKNKNFRMINGKPLMVYTIEQAKRWGKAKRIVCSTDSEEIVKVAKENGIEVIMRPDELASDSAGKVGAIRHAFNESEKLFNEKFDVIVDLDVTSPIRTVKDLDNCLKIFEEKKPEIVFSVVEARRNPYFNMVEKNKEGKVELSKKLDRLVLSGQEAPEVYDMNASIYFYSRRFLLDKSKIHPLSTENAAIYVMDEISAIDIDSELDFKYLEFLIKNKEVVL